MKKIFVLLLCAWFMSCTGGGNQNEPEIPDEPKFPILGIECECSDLPTGEMSWDYPIKEWKDSEDRKAASQIPEEILFSLSTEDLTAICLQYPYLTDIEFFNTIREGLDKQFADFNGLRELFTREGVSKELLKHYHAKIQDLSTIGWTDMDVVFDIRCLEALLSRYQSNDDTVNDYREILQCLVFGYEKQSMFEDFTNYYSSQRYNFYARLQMILKIDLQSTLEKIPNPYKYGGRFFDMEAMDFINELSYQLIK